MNKKYFDPRHEVCKIDPKSMANGVIDRHTLEIYFPRIAHTPAFDWDKSSHDANFNHYDYLENLCVKMIETAYAGIFKAMPQLGVGQFEHATIMRGGKNQRCYKFDFSFEEPAGTHQPREGSVKTFTDAQVLKIFNATQRGLSSIYKQDGQEKPWLEMEIVNTYRLVQCRRITPDQLTSKGSKDEIDTKSYRAAHKHSDDKTY